MPASSGFARAVACTRGSRPPTRVAQLLGQRRAALSTCRCASTRLSAASPLASWPADVAAHAVGDQVEPELGRQRVAVLVRRAPQPDVGDARRHCSIIAAHLPAAPSGAGAEAGSRCIGARGASA